MCDPRTLIMYEASLLALTVACAFVTFRDEFDRPHWRKYRALLFAGVGLSGAVPVLHLVYR
jgi:adiponectin receptor